MNDFLLQYLPVIILFGIATALSLLFLVADDSRMKFDVRFYLVAILFIIFDIEVAFLFPYAVTLDQVDFWAWAVVMIFLAELAAGLAYAWQRGALDWE